MLAPLEPPHVPAIHPGGMRQRLLRQPPFFSQRSDRQPEGSPDFLLLHSPFTHPLLTSPFKSLQTRRKTSTRSVPWQRVPHVRFATILLWYLEQFTFLLFRRLVA